MYELVGQMRALVTVMMEIEKDLKELVKQEKPVEKTSGGVKK